MPTHGVPFRAPFTGVTPSEGRTETWKRIRDRRELVVSMDPANLPYSGAKGEHPGSRRRAGASPGAPARRQATDRLARHPARDGDRPTPRRRCDLVFGEAVADNAVADDEELAGKVLYSRPYYGTGYVLVERKDGPHVHSLAELKGAKSQRLGAEAGSVADYSLRQRGYLRRLFRNQLATLKALNDGDIDYAYLWANVGWTLHVSPDFTSKLVSDYVPEDHWNIAVAMRRGRRRAQAARRRGARCLDRRRDGCPHPGRLPRALLSAVPGADGDAASRCRASRSHRALADRGPEPQMQKIQTSKQRLFRPGEDPLGRRARRGDGSEQPPLLDRPSRAGGTRLRDCRPARRTTGRSPSRLLGHLRARFLPVEARDRKHSAT